MIKYLVPYAATATLMVVLDLVWLGVVAKPLYQQGIGHLMAEQPKMAVAALFYAIFALGLLVFAVLPAGTWVQAAASGALFGFFAYATYDLTNLATLRNWPLTLALLDMAWGTLVSGVSAAAGKFTLDRMVQN